MDINEIYQRVKRTLIVIGILMLIISFIAVFTLGAKIEDNINAVNVLIEYIEKGR